MGRAAKAEKKARKAEEKQAARELDLFVDKAVAFARSQGLGQPKRVRNSPKNEVSADSGGGGGYEGASNDRLHGGDWFTSRLSADSALELSQEELRQRSRSLYRNDAIGGAVDTKVDHIIGTGMTPQARIKEYPGYVTVDEAKFFNRELEYLFKQLARRISACGTRSIWEESRLSSRHVAFDGESFTVISDVRDSRKPIPMVIEVVDPDRVKTPPERAGDKNCRMGVQKDAKGIRIIGYWVQRKHPGENKDISQDFDFVPVERMLHVFEKWFAGQSRGLPWMTRALNRIQDGKDLDEAGIISAQIEACYSAFVRRKSVPADVNAVADADETTPRNKLLKSIEPGTVKYLNDDEEMFFGTPPHGNNTVQVLQDQNSRRIAAALNMAYEILQKDWRGVSFAGGRLVLSGMKLDVKSHQKRMIESWFLPIWEWMVMEAVVTGFVSISAAKYHARPGVFGECRWLPQAWAYSITPGEEINASLTAVNNNLLTKSDLIAELYGHDYEETTDERMVERKTERDGEIVPPDLQQIDQPVTPAPGLDQ